MKTNKSLLRLINLMLAKKYQERDLIKHDWHQYGEFFFEKLEVCNEMDRNGNKERVCLTIQSQNIIVNKDYSEHPYSAILKDFDLLNEIGVTRIGNLLGYCNIGISFDSFDKRNYDIEIKVDNLIVFSSLNEFVDRLFYEIIDNYKEYFPYLSLSDIFEAFGGENFEKIIGEFISNIFGATRNDIKTKTTETKIAESKKEFDELIRAIKFQIRDEKILEYVANLERNKESLVEDFSKEFRKLLEAAKKIEAKIALENIKKEIKFHKPR